MQQMLGVGFICVYVVLVGIATYVQKPLMQQMDAFQMTALVAMGMLLTSTSALLFRERSLPDAPSALFALGTGALMGLGSLGYFLGLRRLPVSVAATIAIGYIVVTVTLAIVVRHEPVTIFKVMGIGLTVAGAALLAAHPR